MWLYGCLSEILFSAARPFLNRKYTEGNDQRYGHYDVAIAKNALWIHAVSVGEVQSAYPFVEQIGAQMPGLPILLSTVTQTGRQMARQLLGKSITSIYYPWDAPRILSRALDELRPQAFVSVETEIWPEMLYQLQKRHIPSFLLNGRLSEASFKKFSRFKSFWGNVIRRYTLIMARSEQERQRFIDLGAEADRVKVTGDCKVDALIERKNRTDLSGLAQFFSPTRRTIIAGSTHPGEERCVFQAYKTLKSRFSDLRLVVVPRHPERAQSVADEARVLGLNEVRVMSQAEEGQNWDILVVDRIGVLFPAYGFAKAAFLGGSLVPKGGQNIMEPAIWGIPCCQGPDYHDFTQATEALCGAGLCEIVHDAAEMAQFFENVLEAQEISHYGKAAEGFFASLGGASLRSWKFLRPHLSLPPSEKDKRI
ncbi:MAG: 3-deoxy-D-manno-octulosonic acid transferase [Pyramidobacter sp.]|jgi:3-deoxy-D-manno-octulosonic-acid transferase